MSNIHSEQIKVGKLDIHYLTGGEGEPLVVLHGGGSGANEWMDSMTELCKNYRLYVPDLPGFGRSQQMDGDYTISDFVDFIEDFTHGLGLTSFHLVGHSLGGGLALRYAVRSPQKIVKLVLVNSMSLGKEVAIWICFLSSSIFCRSLGVAVVAVMESVKWLINLVYAPLRFMNPLTRATMILGPSMTVLREQATAQVNQFSELMIPTLLVWGAKDTIIPVSNAYAAARLIPDCQLHVFEDGGHSVHRQKVKEFAHLLTCFLC